MMAVAFSATPRNATVAGVGGLSRRRTGRSTSGGFRGILPATAGAAMGAVGRRSLFARRHGSPILLIPLVPGIDSDIALPALLVDVAAPGFGGIGLQIGTLFAIGRRPRPFVGPAGGRNWRQILL